jgi:hypothetical protein
MLTGKPPGPDEVCDKCGTPVKDWDKVPCVKSLTKSPRHSITKIVVGDSPIESNRRARRRMTTDSRPYCECGYCDATGRNGGKEVRLPQEAWKVAGYGDLEKIAVAPSHAVQFEDGHHKLERHRGWVAVMAA